ncbi:MAG: ubiquitin-conjugating enzyme E2 variant [Planctomycetota bacterium]|jgi:hypothetical protein
MRTREQCRRLAIDEKLVDKYMPGFRFYDKTGDTYVEGSVTPNGTSNSYRLRLDIPPDYPNNQPRLFVISPVTLWKHRGRGKINDEEVSHSFHTLGTGHGGCVEICTLRDWDASMTCVKLLIMGVLWLEAYTQHLQTGESINERLLKMRRLIKS